MKLIFESWRQYLEEAKGDRKSLKKLSTTVSEPNPDLLKEAIPIFLPTLMACEPENNIVSVRSGVEPGMPGGDTGGISWESLPDCTQKLEWSPPLSDPRWETGVPVEELRIIGRSESLPADTVGEYIGSVYASDQNQDGVGDFLIAWWNNIPDTCSFWTSEYNPWTQVQDADPRDMTTMETIYDAYSKSPLLMVSINFPVVEQNGKIYLKSPHSNGGSFVGIEKLNSECVQLYLQTIGKVAEDYSND